LRILVVDDDLGTLNSIKIGLFSRGHDVYTAASGEAALRIFQSTQSNKQKIDLLITDLRMREMPGLELIQSVRKIMPGIKAILITAYGDDSIKSMTLKLGQCAYLEKPFRPEDLLRKIENEC
jgi:DNA-binding response OmpR family regulator